MRWTLAQHQYVLENLKAIRTELGLSMTFIARKLTIITPYYKKWEIQNLIPSLKKLLELESVLYSQGYRPPPLPGWTIDEYFQYVTPKLGSLIQQGGMMQVGQLLGIPRQTLHDIVDGGNTSLTTAIAVQNLCEQSLELVRPRHTKPVGRKIAVNKLVFDGRWTLKAIRWVAINLPRLRLKVDISSEELAEKSGVRLKRVKRMEVRPDRTYLWDGIGIASFFRGQNIQPDIPCHGIWTMEEILRYDTWKASAFQYRIILPRDLEERRSLSLYQLIELEEAAMVT